MTTIRLRHRDADLIVEVDGNQVEVSPGAFRVQVLEAGDGRFSVEPAGTAATSGVAARDGDVVWVAIEGRVFDFRIGAAGSVQRAAARGHEALTPPMPATVVRVDVKPGDTVHAGDLLLVLEAMKMELQIHAPRDGVVRAVNCKTGDLVQPDLVLVDLG